MSFKLQAAIIQLMKNLHKLTSPKVVHQLLDSKGLRPRKRWGQNFLCDENILNKIIESAALQPDDAVLEIGGGIGALSQQIAAHAGEVVVVEIDSGLFELLKNQLEDFPNVQLINADILELDWAALFPNHGRFKCLGNLPYNITSPLLERLIASRSRIEEAIWMVQQEVADKLVAKPGSRESSSLGVMVQANCDVELLFKVSHNAFFPKPEVGSAVLRIRPLAEPRFRASPELFQKIVRASFGMRRKTLLRALSMAPGLGLSTDNVRRMLTEAGIEANRRGETLSLEELDRLASLLP